MRILYYYSKLGVGGAERSSARLLNKMAQHGMDVTFLLRWDGGALEKTLDSRVRVIHLMHGDNNPAGIVGKLCFVFQHIAMRFKLKKLEQEEYDLCLSGLFGYDPEILFSHIHATRYFQLLRNDVEKTGLYGKTREYMEKYGTRFDCYIGVSEYTTESFRRVYPALQDRTATIYNVLPEVDAQEIEKMPDPFGERDGKFRILTVCRLADKAKGLFRMVDVCRELVNTYGKTFRWYIVGRGDDREAFAARIAANDLEDVMILLGEQQKPFPYYVHADLVAVLSYYEGLCGVVNEAKILCRPVIATEFSGIHEQLENGVNGIIVENNQEAILCAMKKILANPAEISSMAINGMPEPLRDNDHKVKQFEELYQTAKRRKTK